MILMKKAVGIDQVLFKKRIYSGIYPLPDSFADGQLGNL
jgi:hypothetical protein